MVTLPRCYNWVFEFFFSPRHFMKTKSVFPFFLRIGETTLLNALGITFIAAAEMLSVGI